MADARLLMAEHCRGRFDAEESGRDLEFRCREQRADVAQIVRAHDPLTSAVADGQTASQE
jgi:membrane-bound inhibitor of C-type lysozyme